MSKKVKILDYADNVYETDVDIENVELVFVSVITGDEIFMIQTKDDDIKHFDAAKFSGKPRLADYYDYSYTVLEDELEKWNKRKDSYEYEESIISN